MILAFTVTGQVEEIVSYSHLNNSGGSNGIQTHDLCKSLSYGISGSSVFQQENLHSLYKLFLSLCPV